MCKRWTAAGMLVAEQQFRRIIGYKDLAKLVAAIERQASPLASPGNPDAAKVAEPATVCLTVHPSGSSTKFHDDPGNHG